MWIDDMEPVERDEEVYTRILELAAEGHTDARTLVIELAAGKITKGLLSTMTGLIGHVTTLPGGRKLYHGANDGKFKSHMSYGSAPKAFDQQDFPHSPITSHSTGGVVPISPKGPGKEPTPASVSPSGVQLNETTLDEIAPTKVNKNGMRTLGTQKEGTDWDNVSAKKPFWWAQNMSKDHTRYKVVNPSDTNEGHIVKGSDGLWRREGDTKGQGEGPGWSTHKMAFQAMVADGKRKHELAKSKLDGGPDENGDEEWYLDKDPVSAPTAPAPEPVDTTPKPVDPAPKSDPDEIKGADLELVDDPDPAPVESPMPNDESTPKVGKKYVSSDAKIMAFYDDDSDAWMTKTTDGPPWEKMHTLTQNSAGEWKLAGVGDTRTHPNMLSLLDDISASNDMYPDAAAPSAHQLAPSKRAPTASPGGSGKDVAIAKYKAALKAKDPDKAAEIKEEAINFGNGTDNDFADAMAEVFLDGLDPLDPAPTKDPKQEIIDGFMESMKAGDIKKANEFYSKGLDEGIVTIDDLNKAYAAVYSPDPITKSTSASTPKPAGGVGTGAAGSTGVAPNGNLPPKFKAETDGLYDMKVTDDKGVEVATMSSDSSGWWTVDTYEGKVLLGSESTVQFSDPDELAEAVYNKKVHGTKIGEPVNVGTGDPASTGSSDPMSLHVGGPLVPPKVTPLPLSDLPTHALGGTSEFYVMPKVKSAKNPGKFNVYSSSNAKISEVVKNWSTGGYTYKGKEFATVNELLQGIHDDTATPLPKPANPTGTPTPVGKTSAVPSTSSTYTGGAQSHSLKDSAAHIKATGKVLGSHGAKVMQGPSGAQYLHKPQAEWQTELDLAVNKVLHDHGLPAPVMQEATFEGKSGSLQSMYDAQPAFPSGFNVSRLSTGDHVAIQKQMVMDLLIGNHDAHADQWLKTSEGNLVAIDQGQAFKFGTGNSATWTPPGNHGTPIYKPYLKSAPAITPQAAALAQAVSNMSDAQIKATFGEYAKKAASAKKLPNNEGADAFLKDLKEHVQKLPDIFSGHFTAKPQSSAATPPGAATGAPTGPGAYKITLPSSGGMFADGGAITKLINAEAVSPAQKAQQDAAITDALKQFKDKHGAEFDTSKVTNPGGSTFVPASVSNSDIFDNAKAAGYEPVSSTSSLNGTWKPSHSGLPNKDGAYKYSGSLYTPINSQLRKGKKSPTGGKYSNIISQMDMEFAAVPPIEKDSVLIRKMKADGPFPGFPPPMKEGALYVDHGYGSTSKSGSWAGNVVMEVRVPAGTKALDLNFTTGSQHSTEQEVLLNRGTWYQVVSDEKVNGVRKIVVTVVNDGAQPGKPAVTPQN